MPPKYLWVNKTALSDQLSHSAEEEAVNIRQHVQAARRDQARREWRGLPASTASTSRNALISQSLPAPLTLSWMWSDFNYNERRSLAYFELRTSSEWSGWADASFWTTLALPLCHQNKAIADSLAALAAIHESSETNEKDRCRQLQRQSLTHAQMAIGALAQSQPDHFLAIVSCLLFVCLCNVRQERGSFRLLRSGLRLLDEQANLSVQESHLIASYAGPLLRRLSSRDCTLCDLAASFALSLSKHRASSFSVPSSSPPSIPFSFVPLRRARDSLEAILKWGQHSLMGNDVYPTIELMATLTQLRREWESALDATPDSSASTFLLRAACIFGFILITTANSSFESIYDAYLNDFQTMTSLVEQAIASRSSRSQDMSFGIDGGLVDILGFVGSKCRDPLIRRRAAQLLIDADRFEGDRVASTSGDILQAQFAVEEKGLFVETCHDVPESNRRRLIRGEQYVGRREIDLFFARWPYDDESVVEKMSVPLQGCTGNTVEEVEIPDVIIAPGYAEFLDERETKRYYRVDLERFYFPIPRL